MCQWSRKKAAGLMKPMPGMMEVWWAAGDAIDQALASGDIQWEAQERARAHVAQRVPGRKRSNDAKAVAHRTGLHWFIFSIYSIKFCFLAQVVQCLHCVSC